MTVLLVLTFHVPTGSTFFPVPQLQEQSQAYDPPLSGAALVQGNTRIHQNASPQAVVQVFHVVQLRNLLWATSAFDFYYLSDNIIMLYNSLSHRSSEVGPSPAEASQCGRFLPPQHRQHCW